MTRWETQILGHIRVMECGRDIYGVGEKDGQQLLGTAAPDERRCAKGLGFEMGPPSLFEKRWDCEDIQ